MWSFLHCSLPRVCLTRFESEIWSLNVLVAPYFGCLCLCRLSFVLDGKMVNFGDFSHTILTFFAPGESVNEVSSSWKMDVWLWNKEKRSVFAIFGTSTMILHNTTLQRPFPELKKHCPTNLYMLYPIEQSIVLVCIEIDKKTPPQWHCPSSLENLYCPFEIILAFKF